MIKVQENNVIFYFEKPEYVALAYSGDKSLLSKVQLAHLAIDTRTNNILKCRYNIEELIEKGLSQYES